MAKKIKITESQYNNLKQFLVETPFSVLVKNTVKVGDIIKIKIGNLTNDYKVVASLGGQIQMDGINTSNKNFRYLVTQASFENNEIEGLRIDKLANPQLLKTPNKWENFTSKVDDFQVIRNNKVIDSADINGKPNSVPEPEVEPIAPEPEVEKSQEDLVPEPEVEKRKKQKEYGKKALEAITSDPILQAAFYKQPSFWNLFMADLKGKTAPGKGIEPTLNLINGYLDKQNKKNNPELSAFKMGRKAEFIILDSVTFTDDGNKKFEIPANNKPYSATNIRSNFSDKTMGDYNNANMLQYSDNDLGFKFRIMVKLPSIKKDTFNCDIVYDAKVVAKNIRINFLNSTGYNSNENK